MSITSPTRPSRLKSASASLAEHAKTTPGHLHLALTFLVGLALLAGVALGGDMLLARQNTHTISATTSPLLAATETVYSSLADADTTAATGFLAGGLPPVASTKRYDADVAAAGQALQSASTLAGSDATATTYLQTIASNFPTYTGLVASARANNRQGFPVGDAYLSQASALERTTLLPAASALLTHEQKRLGQDFTSARSYPLLILSALVLLALLAMLLRTQAWISKRTRRRISPALLAASLLTLLSLLSLTGLALLQSVHLHTAQTKGSIPVVAAGEARIDALRLRADEALTLAARGADPSFEADYKTTYPSLLSRLTAAGAPASLSTEAARYDASHVALRAEDDKGDYPAAVASALGATPSSSATTFNTLDSSLLALNTSDQTHFSSLVHKASMGLAPGLVLFPLIALVIALLAWAGIRPRLEEYR